MSTQQPEALRLANILRGIDARSLFANEKLSAASVALENQHARITELEAARFAYASEFAPTSDGDPDVSSIHADIRALKAQLAQCFVAADMATASAQGFRDGVASLTVQAADSQPAQVMGDTPPPCDQELFDQGVSVGLFDIPKWTAEALCRGIAAATEARVDWHYIGGRVHIKALPAARAPADSVLEDANCAWSNYELTAIYNEANGITVKNPPITTERIFAAMRRVAQIAARAAQKEGS